MNKIAMHTRPPTKCLKKANNKISPTQQLAIIQSKKESKAACSNKPNPDHLGGNQRYPALQPKRILRRLPIPPNPLATRQIFVLYILLVALPLVSVFGDVGHALGGFAVRTSDRAGDVADGGLEGFVEDLADWVADDAEETLGDC